LKLATSAVTIDIRRFHHLRIAGEIVIVATYVSGLPAVTPRRVIFLSQRRLQILHVSNIVGVEHRTPGATTPLVVPE